MNHLEQLLQSVQAGETDIATAARQIGMIAGGMPEGQIAEFDFARIDLDRERRTGFPEVIYGESKSAEQISAIARKLAESHLPVLATRVSADKAAYIQQHIPGAIYHNAARVLTIGSMQPEVAEDEDRPTIAIVCAGTSDLPIAEESALTIEFAGLPVNRIYDVGVAGLHRLLVKLPDIRQSAVIIVIAGMEGALPGVLSSLVSKPVIAVPSSVGYGANLGGITPLLAMLSSCSPGLTVTNIDNGFGAACAAIRIIKLLSMTERSPSC
ncbi:nickel pincer cofactor biosynthesis protein LarB [Paenibacillus agaridevorans]|uniref:nickel pincer cofactor biosynthesis protein LarB n=1 Tax=Paenibacillus agaridevorans TaxID=171404 RepID=UPI001BE48BF3|nr:nickel pincer cofactor biosynthesis protein LarB [Paenibacillus agaridevorans]